MSDLENTSNLGNNSVWPDVQQTKPTDRQPNPDLIGVPHPSWSSLKESDLREESLESKNARLLDRLGRLVSVVEKLETSACVSSRDSLEELIDTTDPKKLSAALETFLRFHESEKTAGMKSWE